jgi:hypothetical protein
VSGVVRGLKPLTTKRAKYSRITSAVLDSPKTSRANDLICERSGQGRCLSAPGHGANNFSRISSAVLDSSKSCEVMIQFCERSGQGPQAPGHEANNFLELSQRLCKG